MFFNYTYAIEKEVNICYFQLCSNQLSQCVLGVFLAPGTLLASRMTSIVLLVL